MIFASNNKGKLKEIKNILTNYNVISLKEAGVNIDVEEDGKTFYENALKKAKEIYKISNQPVIADDSGLCVCSLNDWPGILTHRFLGEDATDNQRNNKIIEKVNDADFVERKAKVVCCLVYYDGINTLSATGEIFGKITNAQRGVNGFGFDSIFELENGKTLAELSTTEKDKVSARAVACEILKIKINELIKNK